MEKRFKENKIKIRRVLARIAANGPPKMTEKEARSIIEELKQVEKTLKGIPSSESRARLSRTVDDRSKTGGHRDS